MLKQWYRWHKSYFRITPPITKSSETVTCYSWTQNWIIILWIKNSQYLFLLVSSVALKRKWKLLFLVKSNSFVQIEITKETCQLIYSKYECQKKCERWRENFVHLHWTKQPTTTMYLDLYCGNPVEDVWTSTVVILLRMNFSCHAFAPCNLTVLRTPPEPAQMIRKLTFH